MKKELKEYEKKHLDEVMQKVGKLMVMTMDLLDLQNYITASYTFNDDEYVLTFEKLKK